MDQLTFLRDCRLKMFEFSIIHFNEWNCFKKSNPQYLKIKIGL